MANVIWSDSFNRTALGSNDNAFGGTAVHPWSAPNGSVGIYENALGGNSTLTFYRYGVNAFPCPASGIFLEGPATRFDGFNDMGISARWISTTDHAFVAFNATNVYIFSRVANTGLTVASVPFVVKPGDLIGMYANGQHYEGWVNGVKVTEYDEARIASAGTIAVRSPYNGANFRVDQMIAYDAIPYGAVVVRSGSATVASSTVLAATGKTVRKGTAGITSSTVLGAAGVKSARGTATLTAIASLTAAGSAARKGTAWLGTTTTLGATGATTRRGTTALTASTTLAAQGFKPTVDARTGTAQLTTATTLTAAGKTSTKGAATLTSSTGLTAAGVKVTSGAAQIGNATVLEAAGHKQPTGAATLATTTTLTAASGQVLPRHNITITATLGQRPTTGTLLERGTEATLKTRAWEGKL